MSRITLTRELAFRAAWDVGMRSMREGERWRWNQEDFDAAAREFDRLWPLERDLVRKDATK